MVKNLLCILFVVLCLELSYAETFTYHWEIDETPSGQETVSIPDPIEVEIEDSGIKASLSDGASVKLASNYDVYLSPQWDSDKTYALSNAMNDVMGPVQTSPFYSGPSYWILSDAHVPNDIQFSVESKGVRFVVIASEAFNYANPLMAKIDGIKGRFFSRRLYKAIVRFLTDNGSNRDVINTILHKRYGVTLRIPNNDYLALTQNTTHETADSFSEFKPEEMIALISMLEEYPSGMLKTPGLKLP